MSRGIEHRDVGDELTKQEWLEGAHYFRSGTAFPSDAQEGDLFYRIDQHVLYIFDGTSWKPLGPTAVYG